MLSRCGHQTTKADCFIDRGRNSTTCSIKRLPTAEYALQVEFDTPGSVAALHEGFLLTPKDNNLFEYAIYNGTKESHPWPAAPAKLRRSIPYRAIKRGNTISTVVKGTPMHAQVVPDDAPPWLGLRAWWRASASANGFDVTSDQPIPDFVRISSPEHMLLWSSYYQTSVGRENGNWRWTESTDPEAQQSDLIESSIRGPHPGAHYEALLTYARPIFVGERVDYQFYFEPNAFAASPAIGRTVLLDRSRWHLNPLRHRCPPRPYDCPPRQQTVLQSLARWTVAGDRLARCVGSTQ